MGHPTIRRARGLIDSGRPDLAAELLITVKPESPDQDYDRWTALAAALTLTGDLDRALDSADRTVSLRPEGLDGLIARTRLLHRMGREAEAVQCAFDAIRIHPRNETLFGLLALSYLSLGKTGPATSAADIAVSEAPDSRWAHHVRGMVYRTVNPAAARHAFERALELDPDHEKSRLELGRLNTEAMEAMEAAQAAAREPKTPDQYLSEVLSKACKNTLTLFMVIVMPVLVLARLLFTFTKSALPIWCLVVALLIVFGLSAHSGMRYITSSVQAASLGEHPWRSAFKNSHGVIKQIGKIALLWTTILGSAVAFIALTIWG